MTNKPDEKDSQTRGPGDVSDSNDVSSSSGVSGFDNLGSAVGVSSGLLGSVGSGLGSGERVGVLVRVPVGVREEWKVAAGLRGLSLSGFVRECVDGVVDGLLRCSHPLEFRKVYPWSESCLRCGVRLR